MYQVYKITNKVNGKVYIGFTGRAFKERWKQHCQGKPTYPLQMAIKTYGKDNFSTEIIFSSKSREEALQMEILHIKRFNSRNRKFGYNCTEGGEGMLGRKGDEHPMYGKTHTDEVKKVLSDQATKLRANLPIYQPEILNLIHSLRKEGKPFRVIKEQLDKRNVKTSRGSFYRSNKIIDIYKKYFPEVSDEKPITDRKTDDWSFHMTRNRSPETRRKLSKALKGRTITLEARKKVSKTKRLNNPLRDQNIIELIVAMREEGYSNEDIAEALSAFITFKSKSPNVAVGQMVEIIYREKLSEEISGDKPPKIRTKRGEDHPCFGTKLSEERIAQISKINKGQGNPFWGKSHSNEVKMKMIKRKLEGKPIYQKEIMKIIVSMREIEGKTYKEIAKYLSSLITFDCKPEYIGNSVEQAYKLIQKRDLINLVDVWKEKDN